MKYFIFKNEALINTIIADEEFCQTYCEKNGYTYKKVEEASRSIIESESTAQGDIDATLKV